MAHIGKRNPPNRRTLLFLFSVLACLAIIVATSGTELSTGSATAARALAQREIVPARAGAGLAAQLASLPLSFEENRGQSDPQVRFLFRGNRSAVFLTSTGLTLTLENGARDASDSPARGGGSRACRRPACLHRAGGFRQSSEGKTDRSSKPATVLRMKWVGANPTAKSFGQEPLPGKSNYFVGSDANQWRTNIPHYARVRYEEVYPGVDLIYYGSARQLEFDFVVAPGAQPDAIRFDMEGAEKLAVDAEGRLVIRAGEDQVQLLPPTVYQETSQGRREIRGGYKLLAANRVAFAVEQYDARQPLVIDPVLTYSTYLGGSGYEEISGIDLDSSGNIYVAGITSSTNFPTATPFRAANAGDEDVFVAKLNPAGSALLYSTYLGGTGTDHAHALAVEPSGAVTIVGDSDSTNFPTASAFQSLKGGGTDAIVARLNPTGSALTYSTFLGGNGDETGYGVSVDASGNAYLTGDTGSNNFPLATPLQAALGSTYDAYAAKMNPSGSALIYSTYLGGNNDDWGLDIVADASGNAYLTGLTLSNNFPTLNPFQSTFGGGTCGTAPETYPCPDVFVTKLNAAGTQFVYSTYLGGSGDDEGTGIAVDTSGNAYVAGVTLSASFPTARPFQALPGGLEDVFVTKFNPAGSALVYSTYLGGAVEDIGFDIALDASGNAYVTGFTSSTSFPVVNPIQPRRGFDAFVTRLNSEGSALIYSTYLGGRNFEEGLAIAVDSSGNAYVAGGSNSDDFPRATPLQSVFGGGTCGTAPLTFTCPDGIVSKLVFRPSLFTGGMVNGASFAAGAPVSAGSIVSAFGTDLATSVALAGAIPLPTSLAGVAVRMNNTSTPLFFVSGSQINLQVPWELAGQSQASIVVTTGGTALSAVTVNLTSAAPGIFTTNAQGNGQGAILINSTGEVAAPAGSIPGRASRPANRGEAVTIYCTGLGNVTNRPATGAAASANPLSNTTSLVSVTIGAATATVSFAGLAPGFVGLYQINAEVPASSQTGSVVPVVVSVGGASSNTGVVMAVQ